MTPAISTMSLSGIRVAAGLPAPDAATAGTGAGSWSAGFDPNILGNPGAADLLSVQLFLTEQGVSSASVSSATQRLREVLEDALRALATQR